MDSQYSIVETAPSYASVGFVPQIISSRYPSYEPALTSPHDASRQPSIVMQKTYDPSSSIYNPFLRPGSDGDARFPPFVGPTAVSKYNGNATLLSGPSVSASHETATSIGVASAALTAQGSQMARITPSTIGRMHQFLMHLSWKKGAEVRRKGFLPLYVGAQGEELQRCVVPMEYINHPLFRKLLNEAEEEYGWCNQRAAITILYQVSELHGQDASVSECICVEERSGSCSRKDFCPCKWGSREEELQRCVVPMEYINHPLFREEAASWAGVEAEYGW
ncbi:hypothetical protein KI387_019456 [Taxus chinensis]|uniref:Uncharacterized protein n=1 Tax=Taxus chinensis TaxID=29808 RepID=A0AA38G829_TAXCH|nr:hypothetical protein KI387_019456 [Taxus chinensis]